MYKARNLVAVSKSNIRPKYSGYNLKAIIKYDYEQCHLRQRRIQSLL